jgi:CBS domain-containing protein
MGPPVLTLRAREDLFGAIDRLLSARVSAAPVVEDGRVVGIFTEKDSVRALSRLLYSETEEPGTVGDHMSRDFGFCAPDMDFFRVAQTFLSCHFPTLPVVEDGRLVGVIERKALLVSVDGYRRKLESSRKRDADNAGKQAERPTAIEAYQQAAARTTREQLVRLFSRRKN